jgi:hypothetical protein
MESGYRPYSSDSDDDSDSYTSSISDSSFIADVISDEFLSTNPEIAKLFQSASNTLKKTQTSFLEQGENYSQFSMEGIDAKKTLDYGSTKFTTASRSLTTQLILQSQDRDRTAYPNPTDFLIHFPRTYKNVTGIDLANMNFLNTLLFFRNSRNNTYFDLIETGRPKPNFTQFPASTTMNENYVLRAQIREGSYNITSLKDEVLKTLNAAPPFFYYHNGFTDFAPLFAASGSYALNFNAPGDYLYDSLNKEYITLKSIDDIVLRYFNAINGNKTRYTNNDILVAYYYPAIKEAFLDDDQYSKMNISISQSLLLDGEDLRSRVIYNFQGLTDPIILELINLNKSQLDIYRNTLTYLAYPINQYAIRENIYNKHLVLSATGLANSIKNNINLKGDATFINALYASGLDSNTYSNTLIQNRNSLASISEMRDFIFTSMAEEFGIPFNSYDLDSLFCNTTLFNIQNGYTASNVVKTYSSSCNVNIFPDYSLSSSPNIVFHTMDSLDPKLGSSYDPDEFNGGLYASNAFDIDSALFNDSEKNIFINSNYNICNITTILDGDILNINPKKRSIDLLATIDSSKYAVYKFKSPCRQTIQIETLPIPHKYRYNNYNNEAYGIEYNNIFKKPYEFKLPNISSVSGRKINYSDYLDNAASSNLIDISGPYNISSNDAFDLAESYKLENLAPRVYFKYKNTIDSNSISSINITVKSSSNAILESDIVLTSYADYSAFITDSLIDTGAGNVESDMLYKKQIIGGLSASNHEITLSNIQIRGGDEQYFIVRSKDVNFTNTNFKCYAWYSDSNLRTISYDTIGGISDELFYLQNPESNANMYKYNSDQYTNIDYFRLYDDASIKLPYSSDLYNGTNPEDNEFNNALIPGYPYDLNLGYDGSGVSTDLTDYKGVPSLSGENTQTAIYESTLRFDPESGYLFKLGTQTNYFDKIGENYLNGNNGILIPNVNTPYLPSDIDHRQYKIVHWNDSHYLAPGEKDKITIPSYYNYSSNIKPVKLSSITSHYNNYPIPDPSFNIFNGSANESGELKLGQGIAGMSFLPSDGEWDIESFMFKSAYYDSTTDPNKSIKFIGIFDTSTIIGYNIDNITLSNASTILSNTAHKYHNNPLASYDKQLGAYHIFKTITPADSPFKYIERPCAGYTQSPDVAIIQDRAFYSAIPFDASGNVLTYFMPTGSMIAHQELFGTADIITDTVYINDLSNSMMANNASVFLPSYDKISTMNIPGYIEDVNYTDKKNLLYQSKYEQSIPIITPKIQFINEIPFINDKNALLDYNPYHLIPDANARLYTANFKNANNEIQAGFVKSLDDKSDCVIFRHTFVKDEEETPTERKIINKTVIYLRDIIIKHNNSFYFNPSVEEIITWTENAYAKYVLIYNANMQDSKILKIVGGETSNDPVTISYFLNYNGSSGYNNRVYSGNNISGVDKKYDSFYVTNSESVIFIVKSYFNELNNVFLYYVWNKKIRDEGKRPIAFYDHYNLDKEYYDVFCNIETGAFCFKKEGAGFYVYNINDIIYNNGNVNLVLKVYYNKENDDLYNLKIDNENNMYFLNRKYPNRLFFISNIKNENETNTSMTRYTYPDPSIIYTITYKQYDFDYTTSAFTLPYNANEYSFDWAIGSAVAEKSTFIFKWQTGDYFSVDPWRIYANIQTGEDINHQLQSYSQIFYPTMKITMKKTKEAYNSITDAQLLLTNYKTGNIAPMWGRSEMFLYNSEASFKSDLGLCTNFTYDSNNARADYKKLGIYNYTLNDKPFKWGNESNFINADNKYSGYYFNSYSYNMTLSNTLASDDYYYLAVRASLPSEGFQTIVRINAPNRLDFGFITMNNLIKEIADISANKSNYNPEYLERIYKFNQRFKMTRNFFGDNIYSDYIGRPITTISDEDTNYFSNFYMQMSNIYSDYNNNIRAIESIKSDVNNTVTTYLSNYWSTILPPYAIERERVTDPITFSPLFYSSIPTSYKNLDEEWGLGWNLGFPKEDLSASTVHTANNIYKIFFETIYLRLSDYQGDMNMFDKTSRERLSNSIGPQGQTKQYFAKLLLNSFGSYSSTTFQNPPTFNPPIGKLDKLRFQWIDPTGQIVDNNECDWNAVIRVSEQVDAATADSTFIKRA